MVKRAALSVLAAAVVGILAMCGQVLAVNVLQPGYAVETYATYSEQGMGWPSFMAFDDSANLYVTQGASDSIWRITSGGAVTKFVTGISVRSIAWGGGSSYGDYLYVADGRTPSGYIYKIALNGAVSPFAYFSPPRHGLKLAAIDRTGNYGGLLYTATAGQDHTYKVDTGGAITMFSDFPGWRDGGGPTNIAFDVAGNYGGLMYMATSFNNSHGNQYMSGLFALNTSGAANRFTTDLENTHRIDFDTSGNFDNKMFAIAVSVFGETARLWCLEEDGTATEFAETTETGLADFIFGSDGAMYVAEYNETDDTVIISRISSGGFPIMQIKNVIAEKEDIIEKIDELLDREKQIYDLLNERLESKDYGELKKNDIVKAKQKIHSAIQHEVQSADALDKSIEKLSDALSALGYEPPDPNLTAHWKLDETSGTTACDSTGTNHGTVYGATWTTGQINGALDFDNLDDDIFIGDKDDLDFEANESFSIVAWIQPRSFDSAIV